LIVIGFKLRRYLPFIWVCSTQMNRHWHCSRYDQYKFKTRPI